VSPHHTRESVANGAYSISEFPANDYQKVVKTFTLMVFISPLALPFEVSHPTATLSRRLYNEPKLDTTML